MSFLRRRMASDSFKYDNQDWDIVWDYSMGLPEDNGFTKTIDGANISDELTDNGLLISVNSGGYIRYKPIGFETCNEGIYEVEVKIISNSAVLGQGLRLQLTNDNLSRGGVSFFVNQNNKMFYFDTSGYTQIGICNYNEWLKFRIEIINNIGYVYLNNQQIYSSNKFTTMNMTFHNRFIVQGAIECYVRSIRFKRIS